MAAANPVANPYHVMYTVHFYAGSHDFLIQRAKDHNAQTPIFATEWGTSEASGDGGRVEGGVWVVGYVPN